MEYSPLRRKILSSLVTLPFVGKLVDKVATQANTNEELTDRDFALSVVRILGTMQANHMLKFDQFGSKQELLDMDFWKRGSSKPHTKCSEKYKELLSRITPESEFILPGWLLQLHLSGSRDTFLLTLQSQRSTFLLDEKWIIHEGKGSGEVTLPRAYTPVSSLLSLGVEPLGNHKKQSRLASLARRVAFMNVAYAGDQCPGPGVCRSTPQTACFLWGIPGCLWCCYGSCSACCLYNGDVGTCVNCGACP